MSTTTNFSLTKLEENQAQAYVPVNEALDAFDDYVGRRYGYSLKTTDYTVTKSDFAVGMNASTAKTFTMPAVSGSNAPRAGQRFLLFDWSAALISNQAKITIAVPSGAKLDGVTDGTAIIYGDNGNVELVFVDASTGYVIIRSKGTLDTSDEVVNIMDWMGGPEYSYTNNIALPTASNHTPGYIRFSPKFDVGIDQVIFPFCSAGPSSDASDANIRLGFYDVDSSRNPTGAVKWATEDFKLQGTGHIRSTSDTSLGNIGSVTTSLCPCALSARRFFKKGRIYVLAYHLQATFSAGTGAEINRPPIGLQMQKLNAGAQAWPYTFGSSPTLAVEFSGDTLQRLCFAFRYRRLL